MRGNGQAGPDRPAGAGQWARADLPAERLDALAHPDEPVAAARPGVTRRGGGRVVGDLDPDLLGSWVMVTVTERAPEA